MLDQKTFNDFINQLPEDRQSAMVNLRNAVIKKLPKGFDESLSNNMLHYTIGLSIYPEGYHCSKNTPLPFASIASQKNFIAMYHMGVYSDKDILQWFEKEYPKHSKYKLNMGKSCIRFKNVNAIPFELISELMSKISVDDFISTYESAIKK